MIFKEILPGSVAFSALITKILTIFSIINLETINAYVISITGMLALIYLCMRIFKLYLDTLKTKREMSK